MFHIKDFLVPIKGNLIVSPFSYDSACPAQKRPFIQFGMEV